MDYFRAIVKKNEFSERSYELSGFVLQSLTSNYNAYHIRRKCLETLNLSYEEELLYISDVISGNPKTYQAWQNKQFKYKTNYQTLVDQFIDQYLINFKIVLREHRRYIIEVLNKCDGEIDFLEDEIFSEDNKNYHGWGYRIWLCQKFNLYEDEWKRMDKYFEEDIRNNSAWNYRHFLLTQKILKDQNDLKKEFEFTFKAIKQAPDNESAWNYLMGWFKTYEFKSLQSQAQKPGENNIFTKQWILSLADFPEVQSFSDEMIQKHPQNRYLLHLVIQLLLLKQDHTKEELQQAIDICQLLANEADKIRYNYWMWFQQNIKQDFNV